MKVIIEMDIEDLFSEGLTDDELLERFKINILDSLPEYYYKINSIEVKKKEDV
jgi:hypothetical protein